MGSVFFLIFKGFKYDFITKGVGEVIRMARNGPKTIQGQIRKGMTGDGRKNIETKIREDLFGKKPNKKR